MKLAQTLWEAKNETNWRATPRVADNTEGSDNEAGLTKRRGQQKNQLAAKLREASNKTGKANTKGGNK